MTGSGPGVGVNAAGAVTDTVDTSRSIRTDVVNGAKWATASKLGVQGLQFLVGLVLARLLLPSDFGLLASIYIITGFAVMFFELGLGSALVHRVRPSERDMSTVFWINALSGLVYAGLMWAAAPLAADFFDAPRLVQLMPFVALTFTLSLGVVHAAVLQRQLRFRKLAVVELSAAAAGHAVTLTAALLGAGAFALVLGPLVTGGLTTVLLFAVVRWRPRHFIDRTSVRELWAFSGGMLGFNVVNYWGRNADNLLIGRFFGATSLGFYGRAYNLMLLPVTQITGSLGRVMFPALAAIRDDHERVRSAYLRTLGLINFLTIPTLVGLASTAEALVPLMWGDQWLSVVPLLQILCLAGVPQCVATSSGWLFQSQGKTTTMFVFSIVSTVFGLGLMVIGLQWGVVGVAWAVLAKSWLMAPVSLHLAGATIGLRLRRTLRNAAGTTLSATLMAAVIWGLPSALGWDLTSALALAAQVVAGVGVFVGAAFLFDRPRLREARTVLARRRAR